MNRRHFVASLFAAAAPLKPEPASAAVRPPLRLKITDVSVLVTNPTRGSLGNYVLVKVVTSEPGLYGWGDATCSGSELAVAKFLEEHLKPAMLGRDPMRIEDLWQTLFFLPYYRSGSVHMSAVSGVDMALWDIKGKVASLPVYELLGGKARDRLLTYYSVGGRTVQEVEEGVRQMMAKGYKVIKVQVAVPGSEGGYAVPATERQRAATQKAYQQGAAPAEVWEPGPYVRVVAKLFEHLRKTVGEEVELLHDVHERITPNQAVALAKVLEPYRPFYLEDPLRPEHIDSFRLIRQQSTTPIAMGEIYTGQWEGLELITGHLIDYVRNDLAHCGGITAGKKVAVVSEPYGILTAWHGPGNISPITHMANCHVSLSVPNFGIQEYPGRWADPVREVFSDTPTFEGGHVTVGDKPGLGIDVNEAAARKYPYVMMLRPTIRRQDGTAWPY
jgi:mannonate dehydratase